jgi:ABC-2 type transport system permease protein
MTTIASPPRPSFLRLCGLVFSTFFDFGRRSRRFKLYVVLSQVPVLIALFIQVHQAFGGQAVSALSVFGNVIMSFDLQFLVMLLVLFYGTSICLEEVEGRTLMYLTTRPVPKPAIILGKYAAYVVFLAIMVNVGIVLSFLILNLRMAGDLSVYPVLFNYAGVLTLAILAYTAFFTLLGTLSKRALVLGLMFCFGWESLVQYFPGATQRLTIAHYLKSLLPMQPSSGSLSFLMFRLEPTGPVLSVTILLVLTAVFIGLACFVFSWKDYILSNES